MNSTEETKMALMATRLSHLWSKPVLRGGSRYPARV
jgi:hypothetical protein